MNNPAYDNACPRNFPGSALIRFRPVWVLTLLPFTTLAVPLSFTSVSAPPITTLVRQVLSAAWGDFDNDGRPDLFLGNILPGPVEIYRNTPVGFVRMGGLALEGDKRSRIGGAWADVDNDGDLDLLIASPSGEPDTLLTNRGGNSFDLGFPIGAEAGLGQTALWGDFNRDGWVDGFIANGGGAGSEADYLLMNQGNGVLTRTTSGAIATISQYSHGAAAADYNGDGYLDLLVTSAWNQPNSLFLNSPGGTFTRTTSGLLGGDGSGGGASAAWADYDNDGDLDVLVVTGNSTSSLYLNDSGTMVRSPAGTVPVTGSDISSAVWTDFDNDGFLDIVLARRTGRPILLHADGKGGFVTETNNALALDTRGANGLAVADYDGDGDVDVLMSIWTASDAPRLFRNDTSGHHFLKVRLTGTLSNRSAIGAKIRILANIGGREIWQLRQVGGFDSVGSSDLVAHFGLGLATTVSSVRVEWPSGAVQTLADVAADQTLDIAELVTAPLAILPEGGTFTNSVLVSMFSTISVAEIRYTADGSDPVATSAVYRTPLTVSGATTLKARLYVNGFPVSEIRTAVFAPLPPLRLAPVPGRFTNVLEFSLTSTVPNTLIRYTLDGSAPTADSPLFSNPVRITTSATVQARAFLNGFPVTDIVSGTYRRVYAFENEGIDAAWRGKFFGADYATDPRAAADADPDQDGSNNRQEFTVGTNPIDPLSGFAVGVRAVPEIRFASVPGTTYRILRLKAVPGGDATVVAEFVAKETKTVWVDTDAGVVVNPAFYIVQPIL